MMNDISNTSDIRFTIRRMASEDLTIVSALEQTLHHQPWTQEQIRHTLTAAHHYGWVAVDDTDCAVGYLIAMIVADSADILTCGVETAHQRCGLALRLLDTLKTALFELQAERIFLEVRESNMPARSCYNRAGFQEIGRRRNYYTAPDHTREDAIMMVWSSQAQ